MKPQTFLMIYLSITYASAAPAPLVDQQKAIAVGTGGCVTGGAVGLATGAIAGPPGAGVVGALGCVGGYITSYAGSVISDVMTDYREKDFKTPEQKERDLKEIQRQMAKIAERDPGW